MVIGDMSSYISCTGSVYQTIICGSDGDQCLIIYKHLQQKFELIRFLLKTSYVHETFTFSRVQNSPPCYPVVCYNVASKFFLTNGKQKSKLINSFTVLHANTINNHNLQLYGILKINNTSPDICHGLGLHKKVPNLTQPYL